ncbi:LAMI_0A06590g1_1 [Lachancea mirantina]|uniref:LAMI_0A06590g1_1 n=1 Tax=Lachancea mirantina TaxID=1230905 RepID=A0A1G4IQ97_9SACH|nr:LAMI_0A06590g1_1 [Lachancea mirantina]
MGSQTSKPAETRVFTPQSQVDFTSTLLAQLENATEIDYTRQQLADKYLEQRVSEKLVQLEEETLKKFENKLNTSLLAENLGKENEISSHSLSDKVDALKQRLAKLEQSHTSGTVSDATDKLQKAIVQCLVDNKGKPLNCYEEIQAFKKLTWGQ